MDYEKAELILRRLMAGDRDQYLVQRQDGRPQIVDRPTAQQRVVEKLPRARPRWCRDVAITILCLLVPLGTATLMFASTPGK